jgi:hypothetical protein
LRFMRARSITAAGVCTVDVELMSFPSTRYIWDSMVSRGAKPMVS